MISGKFVVEKMGCVLELIVVCDSSKMGREMGPRGVLCSQMFLRMARNSCFSKTP